MFFIWPTHFVRVLHDSGTVGADIDDIRWRITLPQPDVHQRSLCFFTVPTVSLALRVLSTMRESSSEYFVLPECAWSIGLHQELVAPSADALRRRSAASIQFCSAAAAMS
jgi:hypothetical protein